jgi:hypothetical protein
MEVRPSPNVPSELLRVFIDYLEVPVEVDATGRSIRGTIPAREFGGQAVLTVFLPKTFRPSDLDPKSKDTRTLGLAFYELKLTPVVAVGAGGLGSSRLPAGMGVLVEAEQPGGTAIADG